MSTRLNRSLTVRDGRLFMEDCDVAGLADTFGTPLFVVHGANDPRCPVSESDKFVRAVREKGQDVTYLRFPDEGHGIRKLRNRGIMGRQLAKFMEQNLQIAK